MSYDIFYDKQFIKLRKTGEVAPMMLAGSSNCYEIGLGGRNGRRTRLWENFSYYNRKGKISEKPDVILAKLDADLRRVIRRHRKNNGPYDHAKPKDIRAHFGYYAAIAVGGGRCVNTSWSRWRSQFENGIRKAKTIEELATLGVYLRFWAYLNKTDGQPAPVCIETEHQYFEELRKWRTWATMAGERFYLSFIPSIPDMVQRRLKP